jgi:hypothetical protein
MKLFAYTTRGIRSLEQTSILVSKRAIAHQFRLLNDKNQVKLLGNAFFRSEKGDKSAYHFGKDAAQPLVDVGSLNESTQIQYFQDGAWQTLTV